MTVSTPFRDRARSSHGESESLGMSDATSADEFDSRVPRHQTVKSVVKASRLLIAISQHDGITAADVAREVELPLATAYHLLNTLMAEGMLIRDSARRYYLGPKIATLALAYTRSGPSEQVLSAVRHLAEQTGETAYFSGWRDGQVVALAAIEGSSAVRVGHINSELRGAEHARASGKMMLAFLEDNAQAQWLATHQLTAVTTTTITDEPTLLAQLRHIKNVGHSVEEEEFLDGVGCVSAPVMNDEACYGCITISAPIDRFRATQDRLTSAVMSTAAAVSN